MSPAGDLDRDRVAKLRERPLIMRRESEGGRSRVKNAERGTARVLIGLNGDNLIAIAICRWIKGDGKQGWARGREALLEGFKV